MGQRAPALWKVPSRAFCDAVHHKHADCCTRTGSPDEQIIRVIVVGLTPPPPSEPMFLIKTTQQTCPTYLNMPPWLRRRCSQTSQLAPSCKKYSLYAEIQKIQTAAPSNTAASIMPVTDQAPPTDSIRHLRGIPSVDAVKDGVSIARQHPAPELLSGLPATTVHPHRTRMQGNRDPQSKQDQAKLVMSTPILGICASLKRWSASFVA